MLPQIGCKVCSKKNRNTSEVILVKLRVKNETKKLQSLRTSANYSSACVSLVGLKCCRKLREEKACACVKSEAYSKIAAPITNAVFV